MNRVARVIITTTTIPLELKPIEIQVDIKKIELDIEAPKNETKWLPGVDFSHLPKDQRISVENLLFNECDASSKIDNDIGAIES